MSWHVTCADGEGSKAFSVTWRCGFSPAIDFGQRGSTLPDAEREKAVTFSKQYSNPEAKFDGVAPFPTVTAFYYKHHPSRL